MTGIALAAALAEIDARLGRLEAGLEADRQSRSGLSEGLTQVVEAAGRIAGAADAVAEIRRTTDEAARFTNDTESAF